MRVVSFQKGLFFCVLCMMLVSMPAVASMVYYCPDEPITFGIGSYDFDINKDGNNDIQLRTTGADFDCTPTGNNAIFAIPQPPPDSGSWVYPLHVGDSITPVLSEPFSWVQASGNPWFVSCQSEGCIGLWIYPNDFAYFGLEFDIAGQTHYGWVHIENSIYGVQAKIHAWAYESLPDTGVIAGVVPEPSSALLVVVGVVMTILRSRRSDSGF